MDFMSKFKGSSSREQNAPSPATSPATVQTAEVNVRLGFIRKVYALLTINFAITIGVSCAFSFINPIRNFIVENPWIIVVALVASFALLIVLSCFRLSFPFDVVILYCFVLAISAFVGTIVANYYDRGAGRIVLQAFIATAAVFLAITFYVSITKQDFSFLYGFLGAGIFAIIILIILNFAIGFVSSKVRRVVSFVISVVG